MLDSPEPEPLTVKFLYGNALYTEYSLAYTSRYPGHSISGPPGAANLVAITALFLSPLARTEREISKTTSVQYFAGVESVPSFKPTRLVKDEPVSVIVTFSAEPVVEEVNSNKAVAPLSVIVTVS